MIYQQYPYQNYYRSPISIPNKRTFVNPIIGKKTLTFKDILSRTEKSVDTISSMIPLYQKVKPILDQGKNMFSSVTNFLTKKQEKKIEKVDIEIVTKQETNEKEIKSETFDYRQNSTSSKPFFQ